MKIIEMKKIKFNYDEKKTINLITLFMQVIFVFFTIFFNIYVYDISKNLNIVLFYSLFQTVICFLVEIIVTKFANNKIL